MFTKKTRALSAVLTVCMLISMLACFVVPAVADPAHVDTSGMTNANTLGTTYPSTVESSYVITDLAGMKALARLTKNRGASFLGTTIYLGADIDMNWESFDGFGVAQNGYKADGTTVENDRYDNGNFAFKGSFDGNGYVIKNLYINRPSDTNVGLFNWYYGGGDGEGAKYGYLRNIVIENGIVIGGTNTGSLVGKTWLGRIENCHSNAVVISDTATNYVGGLVGYERTNNGSWVYDSSFSGTVLDSGVDVTDTQGIYSGTNNANKTKNSKTTSKSDAASVLKMNELMVKDSFWKVDAKGRVAVATEATQARKLTINIGTDVLEAYGSEGHTVELKELFGTAGATTALADGDVGFLVGTVFTFGAGNSEITTDSAVNYVDLNTVLDLFAENEAFWATKTEAAAKVAAVKGAIAGGTYADQAAVEADIDALVAFYTGLTSADTVPASYGNPLIYLNNGETIPVMSALNFTKIGIYEEKDLRCAEDAESFYTSNKVIYLCADLDLRGSTFCAFQDLQAGFDGLEHTIKNFAPPTYQYGFFVSYDGPFVQNITFDYDEDVEFTTDQTAGLLMNTYQQHYGHDEYGLIKNITIKNANVNKSTTANNNGFAFIAFYLGKEVKIQDIVIEDNTIKSNKTNNSMFIGRPEKTNTTVECKNIVIRNNDFTTGTGNGYLMIELNGDGGNNWSFEDVLIYGNTATNDTSLLMREYFSKTTACSVDFTNVIAFGNETGEQLIRYREGTIDGTTFLDTNVLKAHNVYVDDGEVNLVLPDSNTSATLADLATCGDNVADFANDTVVGSTEDFEKGVYAYAFNQNTNNGTYVKMVNGKPAFCASADQTRKLVVDFGNGSKIVNFYGSKTETVDLAAELGNDGLVFTEDTASVGTLVGSVFTFGDGDGKLSTSGLLTSDFESLKVFIDDLVAKHPDFWNAKAPGLAENADDFADILDTADQDAIDNKVKELAGLMKLDANDIVPASLKDKYLALNSVGEVIEYNDPVDSATYANIGIYNEADLLAWEAVADEAGSGKTVYLCKDLDLQGSAFVTIEDWAGGFDGQNHIIWNFAPKTHGFFQSWDGTFVKNLVFDYEEDVEVTINKSNAGLLMNNIQNGKTGTLIDNITVRNANITNENNHFGLLIGSIGSKWKDNTVTISNITLENNTLNLANYNGMVFQQFASTSDEDAENPRTNNVTLKNIKVLNNTMTAGSESSWLVYQIGLSKKSQTLTCENILISGNQYEGSGTMALLMTDCHSKDQTHNVSFKNVLAVNNDSTYVIRYREGGSFKANSFSANNVFVDSNVVELKIDPETGEVTTVGTLADLANHETAAAFANGTTYFANANALVYAYNHAEIEGAVDYAVIPESAVVEADETNKAPYKVVVGDNTFYTESDAMLADADADAIKALEVCKLLDATNAPVTADQVADATYTADATFTMVEHNLSYTSNNNGCHTVTCNNNCGYGYEIDCRDENGATHVEASETVEGGDFYKCDDCGYEWVENYVGKLRLFSTENQVGAKIGGTFHVKLKLTNSTDVTDVTLRVEYDQDALEYVSNTLTNVVNNSAGVLVISYSGTPINMVDNLLAQITFKVKDGVAENATKNIKVTVSGVKVGTTVIPAAAFPTAEQNVTVTCVKDNRGDVTGDGNADLFDVQKMLKHFSKDVNAKLEGTDIANADMNDDGDFTIVDVLILLRKLSANV